MSTKTHAIGELSYISGLTMSGPFDHGQLPEADVRRVTGLPGELDALMASGELDAAPISTLEYIRRRERYNLVPNVSISAWGRLGSAVLFSKVGFAKLGGQTIAMPPHGATSNAMIQWLLHRMFGIQATYVEREGSLETLIESYPAVLTIGDDAIRAARGADGLIQLDLGEAWWQIMHTPFVTTVWACQRSLPDADQRTLAALFTRAKDLGLANQDAVVAEASARLDVPADEVAAYFHLLNYELSPVHEQSIRLFAEDLAEVSIK